MRTPVFHFDYLPGLPLPWGLAALLFVLVGCSEETRSGRQLADEDLLSAQLRTTWLMSLQKPSHQLTVKLDPDQNRVTLMDPDEQQSGFPQIDRLWLQGELREEPLPLEPLPADQQPNATQSITFAGNEVTKNWTEAEWLQQMEVEIEGTRYRPPVQTHVHPLHTDEDKKVVTGGGISGQLVTLLIVYCVLIVAGSLGGGYLPAIMKLTHARMQVMVSLVAGLMLGISLFHLLPHGIAELQHRAPAPGPNGGALYALGDTAYLVEVSQPAQENRVMFSLWRWHEDHHDPVTAQAAIFEALDEEDVPHEHPLLAVWEGTPTGSSRFVLGSRLFPGRVEHAGSLRGELRVAIEGREYRTDISPIVDRSVDIAVAWLMAGLLTMFMLIRIFHFHHHGEFEGGPHSEHAQVHNHDGEHPHHHDHDHDGEHDHHHDEVTSQGLPAEKHSHAHHGHSHGHGGHAHHLNWVGVAIGLGLHTLIDGLALAASAQADSHHGSPLGLFGFGTFLAILLHKPLDAVSITSLMQAGNWTKGWQTLINACFSLMCPLGVLIFFLGFQQLSQAQHLYIGCALAAAAGVFLCISLGDLLPEVEFHSHDRVKLTLCLLAGITLAYCIGFLEPEHSHSHTPHQHSHQH